MGPRQTQASEWLSNAPSDSTISPLVNNCREVDVHGLFRREELAAVELPRFQLYSDIMTFCFVQQLNGDTNFGR
jgi:hypothetical protein